MIQFCIVRKISRYSPL